MKLGRCGSDENHLDPKFLVGGSDSPITRPGTEREAEESGRMRRRREEDSFEIRAPVAIAFSKTLNRERKRGFLILEGVGTWD